MTKIKVISTNGKYNTEKNEYKQVLSPAEHLEELVNEFLKEIETIYENRTQRVLKCISYQQTYNQGSNGWGGFIVLTAFIEYFT